MSLHQRAGLDFVLNDDRRQHAEAEVFAREKPHHRHVLDFGRDLRTNAETSDERIETDPDAAVRCRQDERLRGQTLGQAALLSSEALFRADEADCSARR